MRDSIQIRPAQPVDAEVAAVLLYSAYTHTHVTYPLREEHENGFLERLEHFFHQDGNYSGCPGGAARHYDLSLWLTSGFNGGAGGDDPSIARLRPRRRLQVARAA